jgi:hypothetical protein
LGRPEIAEIEISHKVLDTGQETAIQTYSRVAKELAEQQLEAIKNGVSLTTIAESKLEPKEISKDV